MSPLTPAQQSAVNYFDGDSMIIAAAGSGKTRVLVEKVVKIMEKRAPSNKTVAVVTFTEKAAGELRERISRRLHKPSQSLQAGTIHALAASLLQKFGQKFQKVIEINTEFQVLDGPLALLERERTVREGLLSELEAGEPEAARLVDSFGFRRGIGLLQDLMTKRASIPGEYMKLERTMEQRYTERKLQLNRLDFDDLEMLLLKLLGDSAGLAACRDAFSWILVDEFQDTSPIQWEILSRLHEPGANRLVIVGDPRQSIYRFRGADPAVLEKAKPVFEKTGEIFFLNENFRSDPAVIDLVNRVTAPLFDPSSPPLIATRKNLAVAGWEILPLPKTKTIEERRGLEAMEVAKKLKTLLEKGHSPREAALLFRSRTAVPYFEREFKAREIPYQTRAGESLLEKKEILPILLLLRAIRRDEDSIASFGLSRSLLAPLRGEILNLREKIAAGNLDPLREKALSFSTDGEERTNVVLFFKLLERLREIGAVTTGDLVDRIEALRREEVPIPCAEIDLRREAVPLLTIHGAKGLEFRTLFLCDLAARSPGGRGVFRTDSRGELLLKEKDSGKIGLKDGLKKSEDYKEAEKREKALDMEEEKRLLYVALTRAMERIILPLETGENRAAGLMARWIYPYVLN